MTLPYGKRQQNTHGFHVFQLLNSYLLCTFPEHGAQTLAVEAEKQHKRNGQAGHLRDGEGPPHQIQISRQGQQPGRRQQHHKLPRHGGEGRVQSLTQSLEHGAQDDTEPGQQIVPADGPQRLAADGKEPFRGLKQAQKQVGAQSKCANPQASAFAGASNATVSKQKPLKNLRFSALVSKYLLQKALSSDGAFCILQKNKKAGLSFHYETACIALLNVVSLKGIQERWVLTNLIATLEEIT